MIKARAVATHALRRPKSRPPSVQSTLPLNADTLRDHSVVDKSGGLILTAGPTRQVLAPAGDRNFSDCFLPPPMPGPLPQQIIEISIRNHLSGRALCSNRLIVYEHRRATSYR